jgi:hypothetical protein
MNTLQQFEDDRMRKLLTSGPIEKAPSGFSEKVMSMVSAEAARVSVVEKRSKSNLIPVISVMVTLILILSVLLVPAKGFDLPVPAWLKVIKNVTTAHSGFDLNSLLNFNLPWYLPYLFLCIFFLTFFDRGLNGIFQRWKSHASPNTDPEHTGR